MPVTYSSNNNRVILGHSHYATGAMVSRRVIAGAEMISVKRLGNARKSRLRSEFRGLRRTESRCSLASPRIELGFLAQEREPLQHALIVTR
jgi:hypothetical protein